MFTWNKLECHCHRKCERLALSALLRSTGPIVTARASVYKVAVHIDWRLDHRIRLVLTVAQSPCACCCSADPAWCRDCFRASYL